MTFAFFVPALPQRVTSSNAGARSRRDPWSVANAIAELKAETMDALIPLCPLPSFERALVTVTFKATNKRPKLEDCPRCLQRHLAGDAPRWAEDRCACFRAKDVGNYGGAPLKPVLDALVWMGMLEDDDYVHVPEVRLRIERVVTIEEEGIEVTVQDVS